MRVVDRDLIRGGIMASGQLNPHLKAKWMAAPTEPTNIGNALETLVPS
jgi:hypothetical protein